MNQIINSKQYDLENRTLYFSKRTINFTNQLPRTIANIEIIKQLIKSSTSIGANYIEANESLSKKDFIFRIKISKKEAKETCYWLKLLFIPNDIAQTEQQNLLQESTELMKIFGAILNKI